jgi:hypothetical protein
VDLGATASNFDMVETSYGVCICRIYIYMTYMIYMIYIMEYGWIWRWRLIWRWRHG